MRQMFFLVYKKKKLSILPQYSSNTDSQNILFYGSQKGCKVCRLNWQVTYRLSQSVFILLNCQQHYYQRYCLFIQSLRNLIPLCQRAPLLSKHWVKPTYIALLHMWVNWQQKIVPNKCKVFSCWSNVCYKLQYPAIVVNYSSDCIFPTCFERFVFSAGASGLEAESIERWTHVVGFGL